MRLQGHVEMRNAHRILVGYPEWKTPLDKPRRRRKDDIKMYLTETAYESVEWFHLVQDTR
jgi:hypothetical protein